MLGMAPAGLCICYPMVKKDCGSIVLYLVGIIYVFALKVSRMASWPLLSEYKTLL